MNKAAWLFATTITMSGFAMAQNGGVTESTDPAKIAAIEAHAQQLTGSNQAPMAEHEQMGRHRKHHMKRMHSHKHGTKAKKAGDAPMAAESKS